MCGQTVNGNTDQGRRSAGLLGSGGSDDVLGITTATTKESFISAVSQPTTTIVLLPCSLGLVEKHQKVGF